LLRDAENYAKGNGYRYDPIRAYELYKKASETGHPVAVYQVAKCLILGGGVKKDTPKGLRLLKDLAKVLVHSKDFRHRNGVNPVTQEKFVKVADLKPSAISISDFTAKDGTAVVGPKVLSLSDKSLRMMHSTGISTFNWEELPGFVQKAIGYDDVSARFEAVILAELKK
jgi:TPR repeat protein